MAPDFASRTRFNTLDVAVLVTGRAPSEAANLLPASGMTDRSMAPKFATAAQLARPILLLADVPGAYVLYAHRRLGLGVERGIAGYKESLRQLRCPPASCCWPRRSATSVICYMLRMHDMASDSPTDLSKPYTRSGARQRNNPGGRLGLNSHRSGEVGVMDASAQPVPRIVEDRERIAARIGVPMGEIEALCDRWQVEEIALFGSILRDDFGPDSDIDILVRFKSERSPGLIGIAGMERELAELFARRVDLVNRTAIEESRNYIRRKAILGSAQVVYGA